MNQHPKQYCNTSDRFVVMLQVGVQTKGQGPAFEPLSYGLPDQPSPDMLLRRGHRGASFPSEDSARVALKESAEKWKAAGLTFHSGKQVVFLKVEIA